MFGFLAYPENHLRNCSKTLYEFTSLKTTLYSAFIYYFYCTVSEISLIFLSKIDNSFSKVFCVIRTFTVGSSLQNSCRHAVSLSNWWGLLHFHGNPVKHNHAPVGCVLQYGYWIPFLKPPGSESTWIQTAQWLALFLAASVYFCIRWAYFAFLMPIVYVFILTLCAMV